MSNNTWEVRKIKEHYAIYLNGRHKCSCDSFLEAREDYHHYTGLWLSRQEVK